ncbi:MAG: outer membrane lipoprotein carrier protein LolA, partial [Terriglobales bacterium]
MKNGWLRFVVMGAVVSLGSVQQVRPQNLHPADIHPTDLHPMDIRQLAHAVDEHYNHLHSLEAEFTETYRSEGSERVESGTLWLKKPRKMRWEYRSPKEKVFVSDGRVVWFYVPAERQLRKTEFGKLN